MAYRDFYNILGVHRRASQSDIKQAYRTLARQWHPDRHDGDAAVAERFKDMTLAYQTLSDPAKRARYDLLGPLYTESGKPPRPEVVQEAFGQLVGNLFRKIKPNPPGKTIRNTLALSLEQAAAGLVHTLAVSRTVHCAGCSGKGAVATARTPCNYCKGSGQSQALRLFRTPCYHCGGRGFTARSPCPDCNGGGLVSTTESLAITVPAGVQDGQTLTIPNKGHVSTRGGLPGDLLIKLTIAEHPLFQRHHNDLRVALPLTIAELALGTHAKVPTLSGTTTIRIPPGTPPGHVFRLAGRGMPSRGGGPAGDLLFEVALELPVNLSAKAKDQLAQVVGALPQTNHPRCAAFRAAVDERLS